MKRDRLLSCRASSVRKREREQLNGAKSRPKV